MLGLLACFCFWLLPQLVAINAPMAPMPVYSKGVFFIFLFYLECCLSVFLTTKIPNSSSMTKKNRVFLKEEALWGNGPNGDNGVNEATGAIGPLGLLSLPHLPLAPLAPSILFSLLALFHSPEFLSILGQRQILGQAK